jgi:tRNA A37 threonylcarbamoyladenosine dehydratase
MDPFAKDVRKLLPAQVRRGHRAADGNHRGLLRRSRRARPCRSPTIAATDGFLCVCPSRENDFHTCDHRTQVNGSVGYVTSVFGMNAAGVVVRRIAHGR